MSSQLRAWNMGSFDRLGLKDGDWYSMTTKSGSGSSGRAVRGAINRAWLECSTPPGRALGGGCGTGGGAGGAGGPSDGRRRRERGESRTREAWQVAAGGTNGGGAGGLCSEAGAGADRPAPSSGGHGGSTMKQRRRVAATEPGGHVGWDRRRDCFHRRHPGEPWRRRRRGFGRRQRRRRWRPERAEPLLAHRRQRKIRAPRAARARPPKPEVIARWGSRWYSLSPSARRGGDGSDGDVACRELSCREPSRS